MILVLFCGSESVAYIIPILPIFSQNLTLQKAFETVALMNKELKRTEFDRAFCKKFKLLVDRFFSFFR